LGCACCQQPSAAQALGTPLLIGLPTLGLLLAVLGYVTVQLLWLAPALHRKRRLARSR